MQTCTKKEVVTKVPISVVECNCDHCGKLLIRECDPQIGSDTFHPEFKNINDIPWTRIDIDTTRIQSPKSKPNWNRFSKILCDECLKELHLFLNVKED